MGRKFTEKDVSFRVTVMPKSGGSSYKLRVRIPFGKDTFDVDSRAKRLHEADWRARNLRAALNETIELRRTPLDAVPIGESKIEIPGSGGISVPAASSVLSVSPESLPSMFRYVEDPPGAAEEVLNLLDEKWASFEGEAQEKIRKYMEEAAESIKGTDNEEAYRAFNEKLFSDETYMKELFELMLEPSESKFKKTIKKAVMRIYKQIEEEREMAKKSDQKSARNEVRDAIRAKVKFRSSAEYRWGTHSNGGSVIVELFESKLTDFVYCFHVPRLKFFHAEKGSENLKSALPRNVIGVDRKWLIPLLNEKVPSGKDLLDVQRNTPGVGPSRADHEDATEENESLDELPDLGLKIKESTKRIVIEEITRGFTLDELKLRKVFSAYEFDMDEAIVNAEDGQVVVSFHYPTEDMRALLCTFGVQVPEEAKIRCSDGRVVVEWAETREKVTEK